MSCSPIARLRLADGPRRARIAFEVCVPYHIKAHQDLLGRRLDRLWGSPPLSSGSWSGPGSFDADEHRKRPPSVIWSCTKLNDREALADSDTAAELRTQT